ncbi:MAG: Cell division protein FtsI [Chlorobi bacterium OLB6]|nr:MAG: Cell division protein FtsI [Chlorobi bacterium OLB6]MBW7852817.1 PASTA domain-containing protein [Candidatus Kapabacteria bacterium]
MNSVNAYDPIRWRAGLISAIFAFAFVVILGRLFWVQVLDNGKYRDAARKQYESKVELRAERGSLFDRNNREVVGMIRTTSFAADPEMVKHPETIAQLISTATGIATDVLLQKIRQPGKRFVWLARGVNTSLFPDLENLRDPGLIRVTEPKRNFLYGPVCAQLIGVTDLDNNGLTGLELQYNNILRGQSGFVVMQRDGKGRLRSGVNPERSSPQNGHSLELTIDIEFQRIAEKELERGVRESGAVSGTVIALIPSTGEVLAMASIPTYNPMRLDLASNDAIRIRAITDQYEPGSTMKAITAAALIDEGVLKPTDQVDGLGGAVHVGPYVIRDDHPLNKTTFQVALEQSSNVVFATSALRLDSRKYYKYVRDFGFGIPTGIDLRGEVRGVLRKPDQFKEGTQSYMAHGYGLSCTALQMVNVYAAIANGGVMMEPHCVREIRNSSGGRNTVLEPQKIRRVVSAATADAVTKMLVGVVENGTGTLAAIPGLAIAGKTGTSKQLVEGSYDQKQAYTATFVGFYPADNPQVAMIVLLDKPQTSIYGGTVAAPIFKRIVQKTMTMVKLGDSERTTIMNMMKADSVRVPELLGMPLATADTILSMNGLLLTTSSEYGMIGTQKPLAGTMVERGSSVEVNTVKHKGEYVPNVIGLTLRRAVSILHDAGFQVKIRGSGLVTGQEQKADTCILTAKRDQAQ